MIPNRELIDGVILVASGNGYWKTTSPETKRNSILMFHILVPLFTPIFDYFPGKRLRAVGNLPARVVMQWRRWCLSPDYMMVEGGTIREDFAKVRTPMLSISFTDDEMMSATSTEGLLRFYSSAPIERQRISPQDVGARRIGHFGFFRKESATSLWPKVTHWLEKRQAGTAS
jgi:predicted alpha/beta hydrolase